MSEYNDIDAAYAAFNASVTRAAGDSMQSRLDASQEAYDSVTGPIDSVTVWLNKPNDVYPGAWQVISYYTKLVELLGGDSFATVATSYLDGAVSNAATEYNQSIAGIATGTVEATKDDVVEVAENVKEAVQTATKPSTILAAIGGILTLLWLFK